ncbi:hypothetical protein AGABI2DRAFT_185661 [Agaricus bisporus var. bisporus H97]|uniref:hypothetical protein n=1 Tax=Agaricus bisporus var. bisporus (strain H97 / ATCC MYA-4626 / FGSC 10389) TaxID=936046 RepID=UPI00029F5BB0|nr:hypothetical protein AGABI2DRAFT_185661 [Agaricus bisporus var. bisporus H97]EKV47759.1 hypothetical protein AGABI2DRAFT_185661 [Agaricus bisporus var. bisporus H97]
MRRHSERPSRSFYRTPLVTDDLPFDILPIILQALSTRQDYLACTLVSKTFNRIATPLLYRELNSRAIPESPLHHPASTILKRPELAKYVRHVTETAGSVHRSLCTRFPTMAGDILRALSLYTKLISFAWIDDSIETDNTLLSLIHVIRDRQHPLRELTIRTHSDLGTEVWSKLNTLTGLHSISLWCMEGPPRVLQGWSEPLGSTLSHLELGRCAGVPPTILVTVLSHLPLLTNLRLKGAPATSIPTILTCLPNLQILDTEYLPSFRTAQVPPPNQMPTLKSLIVRTNIVDTVGPGKLWTWIKDIVPNPGLEKLKLHAFTMNNSGYICTGAAGKMSSGGTMVSEMFLAKLAKLHGNCLREFDIGGVELTMSDIRYLKTSFAKLELLACAVAVPDVTAIQLMISGARKLHTLKLNVFWIAMNVGKEVLLPNASLAYVEYQKETPFTLEHAISLMLTPENPKLKTIEIGKHLFYVSISRKIRQVAKTRVLF